jgi:hypothetical protein
MENGKWKIMKKLTILWILIFSLQVLAQEKAIALKFDEFSEISKYSSDWEDISSRLKRFAYQLKKHPQMKAVIIGYDQRKQTYGDIYFVGDNRILTLQRELELNGIAENRIIRVVGGIREYESYEFWLLPDGAELPKSHPDFQNSKVVYCPLISIEGNSETLDKSPLEFSADIQRLPPSVNLSYKWIVSAGQISETENGKKIKVDISNVSEKQLKVKLIVEGLNFECDNQAIHTTRIAEYPFKFREFINHGENLKSGSWDSFAALSKSPSLQAKMFIYSSRSDASQNYQHGLKKVNAIMAFGRFPKEKMSIENGGFRDDLIFEIWLYPKNTEPPKPTPTVDKKFVEIPVKKKLKRK